MNWHPVSDERVGFKTFIFAWIFFPFYDTRGLMLTIFVIAMVSIYIAMFAICLFICLNLMQIKREISIMKLVRHPYVVRLHEVCGMLLSVDVVSFSLLKGN